MTKVRIKVKPVPNVPNNKKIQSLTKYGSSDIVVVSEKGVVNIEYFDAKDGVSLNLESVPKLIDVLMFVHNMETRLNREENEDR